MTRPARSTATHAHREAPETSSRSTIFQPVPLQSGQTAVTMTSLLSRRFGLDHSQHGSRHNAVVFLRVNGGDASRARGFHFVLHFHRLHHENSLARLHPVT